MLWHCSLILVKPYQCKLLGIFFSPWTLLSWQQRRWILGRDEWKYAMILTSHTRQWQNIYVRWEWMTRIMKSTHRYSTPWWKHDRTQVLYQTRKHKKWRPRRNSPRNDPIRITSFSESKCYSFAPSESGPEGDVYDKPNTTKNMANKFYCGIHVSNPIMLKKWLDGGAHNFEVEFLLWDEILSFKLD